MGVISMSAHHYYLVYGHSYTPIDLAPLQRGVMSGFALVFYCAHGETTTQALARHNNVNGTWPRILARLRGGNTPPDDFVVERFGNGRACHVYFACGGVECPGAGIYGVQYSDANPQRDSYIVMEFPGPPAPVTDFNTIMDRIMNDAANHMTDDVGDVPIHWVGCRAVM